MDRRVDIAVVGLGPVGLEAIAALGARAGERLRIVGLDARPAFGGEAPLDYFADQAAEAGLVGLESRRSGVLVFRGESGFEAAHDLALCRLDAARHAADRLARAGGVELLAGRRVTRSWLQPDYLVLETTRERFRASVVIDASGETSVLARETETAAPDAPVRSSYARVVDPPAGWLRPDTVVVEVLEPEDPEGGPLFFTVRPAADGAEVELAAWSREKVSPDALARTLTHRLVKDGIVEAPRGRRIAARRIAGLRPLRRHRVLFTGTAAGLGVPWTGHALVPGIRSARAAAEVALDALAAGSDVDRQLAALARYDRRVHDGPFGITFRFQDASKEVVLRMAADEAVRFHEVLFGMPGDLVAAFLQCRMTPRDFARMFHHFWEHYRFEDLPWVAAMNGGMAALAGYTRLR
jgi:flavin-dependent dehydrogenase